MLDFCNVSFKYKNQSDLIIEGLSFKINRGDFVSIVGASGCGKSTIFRLISKLEKPLKGSVFINGENINTMDGYIGYMPQKDSLLPWRTILENAALPLEINKQDKSMAEEYLNTFGLENYKDKYPRDLSGGMRQRVSFIRTLLTGSEILILDEPFSALDAITKISLQEWLLDQWTTFHKTILFITHDVEEALFLSNKVFVVSEKPISKLKEIEVPLPYPRNRHMLNGPKILAIKEDLINELKQRISL
ncbi:ABC transporter ATP-binding protein [Clostridium algidicarnis]|uniref:ABC transporter ATP-binding protein n=1 Tax=Clostridium algidicarnis TaxID=37659 RepID=UPI001CF41D16|nr:ABC transporter ATP-binding protein [Clostridium algidicarnis]MCB2287260.1 ABC transporter ATP-binding protein [Clostridium algidicarnis]